MRTMRTKNQYCKEANASEKSALVLCPDSIIFQCPPATARQEWSLGQKTDVSMDYSNVAGQVVK